jgi:hypothetical protein
MVIQPTLFNGAPREPRPRLSIEERFANFTRENPEFLPLFKRFAVELLESGRKHGSADAIFHRIRWEVSVVARRENGFKVNDHFTSLCARWLAAEDARFAEFFEFRSRNAC